MRQAKRLIRKLAQYVQRRMAEEFGFVLWIPEYRASHPAMNIADVREWVLCYSEDTKMYLFHRGKLTIRHY